MGALCATAPAAAARPRVSACVLLGTLCAMTLAVAAPARADMTWDESGPPDQRGGLHAVAVDPDDDQVVWVIDQSRVWVTDDGGSTWQVVLLISGARDTDEGDDEGDDEAVLEEGDDTDYYADPPPQDEGSEADPRPLEDFGNADARGSLLEPDEVAAQVSVRLRVIGPHLYVCTPSGLWRVPRGVRTLGSGVELRLPHGRPVLDVAAYAAGSLLVGTSEGLLELRPDGTATALAGEVGRRPVSALLVEKGQILAGTPEGLWLSTDSGFEALKVGARGGIPQQIVRLTPSLVAVATGRQIIAVDVKQRHQDVLVPGEDRAVPGRSGATPDDGSDRGAPDTARGDDGELSTRGAGDADPLAIAHEVAAWNLRVRRLAVDRDGWLWAAGEGSVYRWKPGSASWEQADGGLDDRRVDDIAAPASGNAHIWVIGRGGAFRWIPERVHLVAARSRPTVAEMLPDIPTVWELVSAAEHARHAEREHVGAQAREQLLSHLLPQVDLQLRFEQLRQEDRLRVPELETDLLTRVTVAPHRLQLRVMAVWDLAPALLMLVGPGDSPSVATRMSQTARLRSEVHDVIVGRYNSWVSKLVKLRGGEPESVRAALSEILEIQNLEADLYALTAGHFDPITTLQSITAPPPPG